MAAAVRVAPQVNFGASVARQVAGEQETWALEEIRRALASAGPRSSVDDGLVLGSNVEELAFEQAFPELSLGARIVGSCLAIHLDAYGRNVVDLPEFQP